MTFEIVDLEIPTTLRLGHSKYPFAELPEGKAFIIPEEACPLKGVASVRAAVYHYRKTSRDPAKFIVRAQDDGSIAVWKRESI